MIFIVAVDPPKITDWIASIAALIGAPLALWGFVKLIKRDKDREAQIASLADIGQKLTEQVAQLAIQASESQYQSTLMFEQNKLIEKQLDIQSEAFTNSNTIEANKLELQRQKQLAEIKPHFIYNGSAIDYFSLKNKGYCAYNLSLEFIEPFDGIMQLEKTTSIDTNQQLSIYIQFDNGVPFDKRRYHVKLKYNDVNENKYYQEIKVDKQKNEIGKPILDK